MSELGSVGMAMPSNTAPASYAEWLLSWKTDQASARLQQQLQFAASLAATYVAYNTYKKYSDKQHDMLDTQRDIAIEQYDRYKTHYAPCEDSLIDEYCAIPTYTPQYAVQSARARAVVQKAFDRSRAQLLKCRGRFCTGQTAEQLNDLAVSQALVEAGFVTMAFRYEESRVDYKNQLRHDRLYVMFGLAKGIPMQSAAIFGGQANSYGALATSAQQSLSAGINGVFQSWSNMITSRPVNFNGEMGRGSHYSAGGSNAYASAPGQGPLPSNAEGHSTLALGSTPRPLQEGSSAVTTIPYIP